jgi:predicted lipoprotein with Yx(FWY)xxD motif
MFAAGGYRSVTGIRHRLARPLAETPTMPRLPLLVTLVAALLLAGAGEAMAAARGTTIKVVDSEYGRILADGRGQAVYLFDRETTRRPRCYGACAEAWPPVFAKGRPRAGGDARQGLLGVTRRRDGRRQVTYRGRPLYFYVHDSPGRVLCHDVREFGGLWLVVRPDGTPVG